jgi:hypothetical protein
MSIFKFCDAHADSGLGVALVDSNGIVVTSYVDPSDYPDMQVDARGRSVCGRWLCPHSGILETNPNFFKK